MGRLALFFLFGGALVCATSRADEKTDAIKMEREALRGRWVVVSGERNGTPIKLEFALEYTFTDDRVTGLQQGVKVEGRYEVGPSKEPKTIDITITKPYKLTVQAIYSVDGDKMELCENTTQLAIKDGKTVEVASPRPTKFDSKQGVLYRLERKKK